MLWEKPCFHVFCTLPCWLRTFFSYQSPRRLLQKHTIGYWRASQTQGVCSRASLRQAHGPPVSLLGPSASTQRPIGALRPRAIIPTVPGHWQEQRTEDCALQRTLFSLGMEYNAYFSCC